MEPRCFYDHADGHRRSVGYRCRDCMARMEVLDVKGWLEQSTWKVHSYRALYPEMVGAIRVVFARTTGTEDVLPDAFMAAIPADREAGKRGVTQRHNVEMLGWAGVAFADPESIVPAIGFGGELDASPRDNLRWKKPMSNAGPSGGSRHAGQRLSPRSGLFPSRFFASSFSFKRMVISARIRLPGATGQGSKTAHVGRTMPRQRSGDRTLVRIAEWRRDPTVGDDAARAAHTVSGETGLVGERRHTGGTAMMAATAQQPDVMQPQAVLGHLADLAARESVATNPKERVALSIAMFSTFLECLELGQGDEAERVMVQLHYDARAMGLVA